MCLLLSVIYVTILETNSIMHNITNLSKNVVPSIIGTLISFLSIYFFLARKGIFLERINSKLLTTDQAYHIIIIHEGSIAGGVVKLIYKFLVYHDKNSNKHPSAKTSLQYWYRLVNKEKFKSFDQLRHFFPKADRVGKLTVFNIGGNKFRLIAAIHYNRQKIYIRSILTHEEYDEGK